MFDYVEINDTITSLYCSKDEFIMNWIKKDCHWGKVITNLPLDVRVDRKIIDDKLQEMYSFTNNTEEPIYTMIKDIKIVVPFADEYIDAETSLTKRCHTHIWCGGANSYILGLRMNGLAPHLGLILKKGSLEKYSVERFGERQSNDRGVFSVHPSPMIIEPNETVDIVWDLYWVDNRIHFEKIRKNYSNQLMIHLSNFVAFEEEDITGEVIFHSKIDKEKIKLFINEKQYKINLGKPETFKLLNLAQGEYKGHLIYENYKSYFSFLVYPKYEDLKNKRIQFITNKQQHETFVSHPLNGSFLCYDNEEKHQFYSLENDYNSARERIGMGVILARYLQKKSDVTYLSQLNKFTEFLLREIVDKETGEVFNDFGYRKYFRLYNYPWVMNYFYECFKLTNDSTFLKYLLKVFDKFYHDGGSDFYPIGLYFSKWYPSIKEAIGDLEARVMLDMIRNHANNLISTGLDYPKSEVNYEQSIVAPAVSILLETYILTQEPKYLENAKKHLEVLELFDGYQPDFHLYNVAIRHWDGYWFGKDKVFGDTFPHYWSSLSGYAYLLYYKITGDQNYLEKANYSLRASLSLIRPDGTGSCAYIYPYLVNDVKGEFYDPMANDQDWAIYYADQLLDN